MYRLQCLICFLFSVGAGVKKKQSVPVYLHRGRSRRQGSSGLMSLKKKKRRKIDEEGDKIKVQISRQASREDGSLSARQQETQSVPTQWNGVYYIYTVLSLASTSAAQ